MWLLLVFNDLSEGADTLCWCNLDLKCMARIIAQDNTVDFVHLMLRTRVIVSRVVTAVSGEAKQPHHVTMAQP